MSFTKEKISSKNSTKTAAWKLVPDPKFLKQAAYTGYTKANLSKFVQISMLTSSNFFLQSIL